MATCLAAFQPKSLLDKALPIYDIPHCGSKVPLINHSLQAGCHRSLAIHIELVMVISTTQAALAMV